MNETEMPLKLSPIDGATAALGADFTTVAGWRAPELYGSAILEATAARESVGLADNTANGRLLVQGAAAGPLLQATWATPALAIGEGAVAGPGAVYCLRQDRYVVHTPPGGSVEALEELLAAVEEADSLLTVTDMSHGWAELLLLGPAAPALLGRLCGLDLHDDAFPSPAARQSRVAKTNQVIIRHDIGNLPAYTLAGSRSLADYLWGTILEAGRDLAIAPIGRAALQIIEAE